MSILFSLLSGLIFGFGLMISGMTQPGKVIGFLDIFGDQWQWDLLGVMGGALFVHALTRLFVVKREKPIFASTFPSFKSSLDLQLILGASIFGLGWGIAGLCPGPALVSIATLKGDLLLFVIMMAIGMRAAERLKS